MEPADQGPEDIPMIYSAYTAHNSELFPLLLGLYVPPGSIVADVTYGRGTFWRAVPAGAYQLRATDLRTGTDCRDLPYEAGTIDCVVLDPPYMEGFYRREKTQVAWRGRDIGDRFSNPTMKESTTEGYHQRVLDMYFAASDEAHRVLRDSGVFIVKCQDEVSNHRQHFTHAEIITRLCANGFRGLDLFVVVQKGKPAPRPNMRKQQHARKNHSYFLVFRKTRGT